VTDTANLDAIITGKRWRKAAREPWKEKKRVLQHNNNKSLKGKQRLGAGTSRSPPLPYLCNARCTLYFVFTRAAALRTRRICVEFRPGPPLLFCIIFFAYRSHEARGRYIIILLLSFVISRCFFFLFQFRRRRRPAIGPAAVTRKPVIAANYPAPIFRVLQVRLQNNCIRVNDCARADY